MKVKQTDFNQTGVAEITLDNKKYLLPLFTHDIVKELNEFLRDYSINSAFKEATYESVYEFFDPKDKDNKKFNLTLNSMEALRTGIKKNRTSFLACQKINRSDFPSYFF